MSLTPDEKARARRLREQHPPMSWMNVACRLGRGVYTVRSAIDLDYRNARSVAAMQSRQRRYMPKRGATRIQKPRESSKTGHCVVDCLVPHDVLVDRDRRRLAEPQSITAALMGDPAPGRSALDRRRGA